MLKFHKITNQLISITRRYVQTVPDRVLEHHRTSRIGRAIRAPSAEQPETEPQQQGEKGLDKNKNYKEIYPDFLPDPTYYFRDRIREKLERMDMLNRRKQIQIPEFYVGSILSITVSDPYAPEKVNRFVGLCIRRDQHGLRHNFTLRNVVDGTAIEIIYDLYNPTIQSIEVLKLEKRLDDELSYLRDCPLEYSTIPFDMQPVRLPPGTPVPVNRIRVKINPKPWHHRWERKQLRGLVIPTLENSEYAKYRASTSDFKPFEKYDLMKNYRETIHDQDFSVILRELKKFESEQQTTREQVQGSRKIKRLRNIPTEQSTPTPQEKPPSSSPSSSSSS